HILFDLTPEVDYFVFDIFKNLTYWSILKRRFKISALGVLTNDIQHPPNIGQHLLRTVLNRANRLFTYTLIIDSCEHISMHADDRHFVGDNVMQLVRDTITFYLKCRLFFLP